MRDLEYILQELNAASGLVDVVEGAPLEVRTHTKMTVEELSNLHEATEVLVLVWSLGFLEGSVTAGDLRNAELVEKSPDGDTRKDNTIRIPLDSDDAVYIRVLQEKKLSTKKMETDTNYVELNMEEFEKQFKPFMDDTEEGGTGIQDLSTFTENCLGLTTEEAIESGLVAVGPCNLLCVEAPFKPEVQSLLEMLDEADRLWTLVSDDDGFPVIVPGFAYVNRDKYVFTRLKTPDSKAQVTVVNLLDEEDKKLFSEEDE